MVSIHLFTFFLVGKADFEMYLSDLPLPITRGNRRFVVRSCSHAP